MPSTKAKIAHGPQNGPQARDTSVHGASLDQHQPLAGRVGLGGLRLLGDRLALGDRAVLGSRVRMDLGLSRPWAAV